MLLWIFLIPLFLIYARILSCRMHYISGGITLCLYQEYWQSPVALLLCYQWWYGQIIYAFLKWYLLCFTCIVKKVQKETCYICMFCFTKYQLQSLIGCVLKSFYAKTIFLFFGATQGAPKYLETIRKFHFLTQFSSDFGEQGLK